MSPGGREMAPSGGEWEPMSQAHVVEEGLETEAATGARVGTGLLGTRNRSIFLIKCCQFEKCAC